MKKLPTLALSILPLLVSCAVELAPESSQTQPTPAPLIQMPGQAQAADLVWHGVYGMASDPPAVDWRTGLQLDCGEGTGFLDPSGRCVFGEVYPDQLRVSVIEADLISQTTLAHEWCHVRSWLLTGDQDADHLGECFLGGLTITADVALRKAGL